MLHVLEVLFGAELLSRLRWVFLAMGIGLLTFPALIMIYIIDTLEGESFLIPGLEHAVLLFSSIICIGLAHSLYKDIANFRSSLWAILPQLLFFLSLMMLTLTILWDMGAQWFSAWGGLFGATMILSGGLTLTGSFVKKNTDKAASFYGIFNIASGLVLVIPSPLSGKLNIDFIAAVVLIRVGITLLIAYFTYHPSSLANNKKTRIQKNSQAGLDIQAQSILTLWFWLPYGNLPQALRVPIISRYWIAMSSSSGVVSVGHVSFEVANRIYASIYPKHDPVEGRKGEGIVRRIIDSCNNQAKLISGFWADPEHDRIHRGTPTHRIDIPITNPSSLQSYWDQYSQTSDYHLVRRNCALTSISLLEASVSGVFRNRNFILTLLRLMVSFQFWNMVHAYFRAQSTLWSPGVALDYAHSAAYLVKQY